MTGGGSSSATATTSSSPSRHPSTSSALSMSAALAAATAVTPPCGDGAYETNEAEDLLFTERYPGKLCALCNLSERSTLGQGDIIKLKLSEDLDFSTLEDKRKASGGDSPGGSHGGISASPKSLNARRKGRKLTSGDNSEPPTDELDQVGFMDDPDLNLLFETSGKKSLIIIIIFLELPISL